MTDGAIYYGGGARLFHWATASLLVLTVPIGLVMGDLPRGRLQDVLFVTHESIGLTILALTALRILWRLTHPAPPPSAALTRIETRASGGVHAILYLLLLAMPVTGYILVVAGGFPLTYFGLAEVPRLLSGDKPLSKLAEAAHVSLQYAVYLFVAMHVAAALHHHFFRRNGVLARMLPRLGRPAR